jgi:hypothetical protein
MDEEPKFCYKCGGKLKFGKNENWQMKAVCSKCKTEFLITYGDQMGGGDYCLLAEIRKK